MGRNVLQSCWIDIPNRGVDQIDEINSVTEVPGMQVCLAPGRWDITGTIRLATDSGILAYGAEIVQNTDNIPIVEMLSASSVPFVGFQCCQTMHGGKWRYLVPQNNLQTNAFGVFMGTFVGPGVGSNWKANIRDVSIYDAFRGIYSNSTFMNCFDNIHIENCSDYAFDIDGGTLHDWKTISCAGGSGLHFRFSGTGMNIGTLHSEGCAGNGILLNFTEGHLSNITLVDPVVVNGPPGISIIPAIRMVSSRIDIAQVRAISIPATTNFFPTAGDTSLIRIGSGLPTSHVSIHSIKTNGITASGPNHFAVYADAAGVNNRLWNKCAEVEGFGNSDPSGVIKEFNGV